MKRLKRLAGLLLSSVIVVAGVVNISTVAQASYTYTVKIVLGGTGEENAAFKTSMGSALAVSDSAKVEVSSDKTVITISDLNYDDSISFDPKAAVVITPTTKTDDAGNEVTYSKYYVKGARRSGANDSVSSPAFSVTQDDTYVIAYGVGEVVPYTVEYTDEAGNFLLDTATYYGAEGEEVYVPYKYVDGYKPDALNIHTTSLKANQVFRFIYKKITGDSSTVYRETTSYETSTVQGAPEYVYQTIPNNTITAPAANNGPGVTNNRVPAANQAGQAGSAEGGQGQEGNGEVAITDDNVPLAGDNDGSKDTNKIKEIEPEPAPTMGPEKNEVSVYVRYVIIISLIGLLLLVIILVGNYLLERDKRNNN